MNPAQLHLLLNHLPVIIPLIAIPILGLGLILKSNDTSKVALWLFVASALIAVPVYFSGGPAEILLKNYPGISRIAIQRHQNAALQSLIGIELVGATSIFFLHSLRQKKIFSRKMWVTQLVLAFTSVLLLMWTSHLGGEIRHEEILSEETFQES